MKYIGKKLEGKENSKDALHRYFLGKYLKDNREKKHNLAYEI